MMISENWASLKREATTLESYVEGRLQSREPAAPLPLPSGAADVEQGSGADPRLVRLREIEESLASLSGVVDRLSALASSSGSSPNLSIAQVRGAGPLLPYTSPLALTPHLLLVAYCTYCPRLAGTAQRFRDVLGTLRQEHRAQSAQLRQRMNAAALLGEAAARSGAAGGGGAGSDASIDAVLLRERSSLQSHNRAIDEILAQAGDTSDSLRSQRDTLASAAGRLGGFLTRIPGATQVMGAISARRSWNDTVVGLVISLCVCYTVYHLVLRKA